MSELNQLLRDIEQAESSSLARKDWQPRYSGVIDIRIASDGTWYHEGRAIQRESLTRLFASVLRKQDDEYFLLTPAEKLSIRVDDAPFVATMLEILYEEGQQALLFTTNLGDKIVADSDHPIRVEIDEATGEPRPYIHFRDGLEALISRTAFFDLANASEISTRDGRRHLTITSMGTQFDLGCPDE
ncbi:MAG: DUF1285 domain-containing protein [Gammaproteobacteria bacterium]